MAGTSDLSFENDPRQPCKYGEDCYQKNPQHLKRFKHPAKRKKSEDSEAQEKEHKRLKADIVPDTGDPRDPQDVSAVSLMVAQGDEETTTDNDETPNDGAHIAQDYIVQESPEDIKLSIEHKFLLEMPEDFFDFWECCSQINKEKPEEALLKAGLTLVGPYDVLTGKLKNIKTRRVSQYVCHWRYYYDPPEFMTVIAGDENEYHIGYFRDDPFHMPNFVASMSSVRPGSIKPLGENIFAGVCSYLTERMKVENPFKKTPLQRLHKEVESYAKKKNYSLASITPSVKERNKSVVAKSFHGAGIVVPVHNDVGYREIPETNANLKKMLQRVVQAKNEDERNKHFEDIQELVTNVQFANDEGDYGMGIELGINLFIYGGEVFHKVILHLLGVGYDLLGREPYVDIIQAHLQNRRRGSSLSIMDLKD